MTGPSSIFGEILAQMLAQLPDAHGAVLADWEGEAVDQAGDVESDEIRLVGAHWGVVYFMARTSLQNVGDSGPRDLTLRFARQQVIVRRLTDDYYIVVASHPYACLARTLRVVELNQNRLLEQL